MASVSEKSPPSPSFKGGGGGGQGGPDRLPPTEEDKKKIKALEEDHPGANENGDENTARFAARDAESITRSKAKKPGVLQPDVILKKKKGGRELKVLGKDWIDVTSDNLHDKLKDDILKGSAQLRTIQGKIKEIVVKINNKNVSEAMIRKAMRIFRTGHSNELAGIRLYAFRYDGKMVWWGICK
jgi:hypothetical protein